MNQYGRQAMRHWQQFLPQRYSQIEDPERFFTQLGIEVQAQIEKLADQLYREQAPATEYLRRVGQLEEAKTTAQEIVLREQVLLPAEKGTPMDENADPETDRDENPWSHAPSTEWMPVTEPAPTPPDPR